MLCGATCASPLGQIAKVLRKLLPAVQAGKLQYKAVSLYCVLQPATKAAWNPMPPVRSRAAPLLTPGQHLPHACVAACVHPCRAAPEVAPMFLDIRGALLPQGSCGGGVLDKSEWPYWSVAALATSNMFYKAGPLQGCGCVRLRKFVHPLSLLASHVVIARSPCLCAGRSNIMRAAPSLIFNLTSVSLDAAGSALRCSVWTMWPGRSLRCAALLV